MNSIWLAFVDDVEGGSRENWNVFHCVPLVGSSEATVITAAKAEITKRATADCKDNGDPLSMLSAYETQYHAHIVGPLPVIF